MTRPILPVLLLAVAAPLAANPLIDMYINEVSPGHPSGRFVELALQPRYWSDSLSGWRIRTSASECTVNLFLTGDPVLIDSVALARREYVWGTLELDPDSDFVEVIDTFGRIKSAVYYPGVPVREQAAPRPPDDGSICCWSETGGVGYTTWFVDSTGTPGEHNQNHSSVSGTVIAPGDTLLSMIVSIEGTNGLSWSGSIYEQQDFFVGGLGAGKYWVTVHAAGRGGTRNGHLPDSIELGYDDSVFGITIVLDSPAGVAERHPPTIRNTAAPTLLSRSYLLTQMQDPDLTIFDLSGRRISNHQSAITNGGVLFLRSPSSFRKVLVVR